MSKIQKENKINAIYEDLDKAVISKSKWGHRKVSIPGKEGYCKIDDLIERLKKEVNSNRKITYIDKLKISNNLEKLKELNAGNDNKGFRIGRNLKQKKLNKLKKNLDANYLNKLKISLPKENRKKTRQNLKLSMIEIS